MFDKANYLCNTNLLFITVSISIQSEQFKHPPILMLGKKTNNVKQIQQENKKLELQAKKMEQELERIRKFKALEFEKEKLKIQMKQLQSEKKPETKKQNEALRGYGEKLKKQTEIKVKKKLDKIKLIEDNSPSSEQDNDTENLKYFMTVLGLPQYFEVLAANKVTNLAKLRQIDEAGAKKMGIPLKQMIKINKKLRSMGY